MSTEIKPGQTIRRVRSGHITGPMQVGTTWVVEEGGFLDDMGRVEGFEKPVWFGYFEVVTTPAPSPFDQDGDDDGREAAPLDPSKVKAGDTVTLMRGKAVHTDEVSQVSHGHSTHLDTVDGRGTYIVDPANAYGWTLTAHQPAPEPEPEWEMAQVAVVTPHGKDDLTTRAIYGEDGNWHNAYGGAWSSDGVSVRPLVVIDPAAVDVDALVEVAHHDRVLYGDTTPDQMRRAILRILAHMGIEATS